MVAAVVNSPLLLQSDRNSKGFGFRQDQGKS